MTSTDSNKSPGSIGVSVKLANASYSSLAYWKIK